VLSLATGAVAAAAAVWPLVVRSSRALVPPQLRVPDWVVDRPVEAGQVVAALLGGAGRTVGITTGLHGAGGFGKTTLARMVCADRRVRRRFRGGVYLVTVGRDTRGAAAVAAKVNDVIKLVAGEEATFTDPELAGSRLGALLDAGPRRLLVVDDVWETEQLAPFASGGRRCARLVTTRVPGLLGGHAVAVLVDQMSVEQSRRLLAVGLPPLDSMVVRGLLAVTGRWPLLLRLVNKILANAAGTGADVRAVGGQLLEQLRASGPAVVDELLGEDTAGLAVGQPAERARAVRATIGASTSLLRPQDAQRFAELGTFAEDETIPFRMAATLWLATAGLDELQSSQLCARLAGLALVSASPSPGGTATGGMVLHDVVRDFLRGELGPQRLTALNGILLDAVAARLPAADAPVGGTAELTRVSWWELRRNDRYLWEHLIEHLLDAGRRTEAEEVAGDLRWAGARVQEFGPAAPAADLSLVSTPRAARLRAAFTRTAHLLAPTEPAGAVVDVLHSRVADDVDWGPQVTALRYLCHRPRLVNRWPLPDLPDSALRRVLTGHNGPVTAVAIAPDGGWLATGYKDGTVRIWDAATGQARAALTGHRDRVTAVVIAPDGTWLATGGTDGSVRIWDAPAGEERATLTGHRDQAIAVAIAPDGTWLATGYDSGVGGKVRIWDAATGHKRATFVGHRGHQMTTVAIAPDGNWLATGGTNGTARIWDTATKRLRVTLTGHRGHVITVAIAPDISWLATADMATVKIWDTATTRARATLTVPGRKVTAVAIAPDSSWLATVSGGQVQLWDSSTGQQRADLTRHGNHRAAVAAVAPDSRWLATGGTDGTVRIWDAVSGQQRSVFTGHNAAVTVIAIAADGSWLATGDNGGTARIWSPDTGHPRSTITGHTHRATAVTVAPDSRWLATIGDGTVRIWDAATGQKRATLAKIVTAVTEIAIAPDSRWLATIAEGTVRIWDAATGQERATLAHDGRVTAMAIAPDSTWLATTSERITGRVQIWDVATGQVRATRTRRKHTPLAVTIAPDGTWLATSDRTTVRIWDVATGRERATLTHYGKVSLPAVTIAPDGTWLATSDRTTVRIWEAATGRQRATLPGSGGQVKPVAVAPDSSWLATNDGEQVRIWEAATGRQRATLPGNRGRVKAVAVAPDSRWLATNDGETVRIWDAATGKPLALMRADNTISACAWLGAERLAAAGWAGLYLFDFLIDTPALNQALP